MVARTGTHSRTRTPMFPHLKDDPVAAKGDDGAVLVDVLGAHVFAREVGVLGDVQVVAQLGLEQQRHHLLLEHVAGTAGAALGIQQHQHLALVQDALRATCNTKRNVRRAFKMNSELMSHRLLERSSLSALQQS
ncbi:hypothetical protein FOCC_FOCC003252 [Frankliniella occidentalis]|nr:hypothetical protein FOCC_FOCC003252 [Frankliniella occidentalis]